LLKLRHPDNGGNVEDMQEINTAYAGLPELLQHIR